MTISRDQIIEAVESARRVIRLWESSDAPNVSWRGVTVKAISEEVLHALDTLRQLSYDPHVGDDARDLILAIDEIDDELQAWAAACEADYLSVHPSGTPELWRGAWTKLIELAAPRYRKPPEPIAELTASGTSDRQIAKMYGFLNADGTPDMVKLAEEKQKAGTHYNPETWVHPADMRRQYELEAKWADRESKLVEFQPLAAASTRERKRKVAPESLDELIALQGMSATQIAKMKGISEDEVLDRAGEIGVSVDGRLPRRNPNPTREDVTRDMERIAKLAEQSHPEITDRDDRILAMSFDGMKPKAIADALSIDYPDLTWKTVMKVVGSTKDAEAPASK